MGVRVYATQQTRNAAKLVLSCTTNDKRKYTKANLKMEIEENEEDPNVYGTKALSEPCQREICSPEIGWTNKDGDWELKGDAERYFCVLQLCLIQLIQFLFQLEHIFFFFRECLYVYRCNFQCHITLTPFRLPGILRTPGLCLEALLLLTILASPA